MDAQPNPSAMPDQREPALAIRSDLKCHLHTTGKTPFYVIEDPARGRFYRMGLREWTFATQLDGRQSPEQIAGRVNQQLVDEPLSEIEVQALCQWLVRAELATAGEDGAVVPSGKSRSAAKKASWTNPFFMRFPLVDPDRFLGHAAPLFGWLLSPVCFVLWTLLLGVAAVHIAGDWDRFAGAAAGVLMPANWPYLIGIWIVLKFLHELFHGIACKRFGGTVPQAGIALILFSPVPYVDVTSCWAFHSKWERITVSAAGMYVEMAIAGIAAIAWSCTTGTTSWWCHNIVLTAGLTTFLFNANMLMKFDGYYMAADFLDLPNLYTRGRHYVRYLGRRYLLGMPGMDTSAAGQESSLVKIYGVASANWRILVCAGLCLTAMHLFFGFGLVLTGFGIVIFLILPLLKLAKLFILGESGRRPSLVRVTSVAAAAGLILYGLFVVPMPLKNTSPAVVEYDPLTMLRACGPGFVREVLVEGGDEVSEGQLLVVLVDDDSQRELADLELAIESSETTGRVFQREGKMDHYQAELRDRGALIKRRDELKNNISELTVRAPVKGRILGRNLAALTGTYMEAGDTILSIGDELNKELIVSISQDHVESIDKTPIDAIQSRIVGRPDSIRGALSIKTSPRATTRLPHEALGAGAGGPLPIERTSDESTTTDNAARDNFRLTEPRFVATISLAATEAQDLRAGEIASVAFGNESRSIGETICRSVADWFRERMESR